MFGFNKKKRMIEGPVEFIMEAEIQRPAHEVFPLIDMADPRYCHVQRGAELRQIEGSSDRYDMVVEEMDDVVFQFRVLERVEGERHSIECTIKPQINALVKSVETHVIKPISDSACHVTLTTSATFDEDLSDEEVTGEIAMMSAAVSDDLEKLAVLAEEGLEAVKALDEAGFDLDFQIEIEGGEIDFDWDDIETEQ
ncbi:MAG: hypothetical protein AAFR64_14660 [Pseudomonadota bacterium]